MNVQTMTWKQLRRKWRGHYMALPGALPVKSKRFQSFAAVFDEMTERFENGFWQRNRRHGIALKRAGKVKREG